MAKRTNIQIKEDIFRFMKSHGIMTLAAQSNDEPWVCTLYYGVDEKMNLYIVTDPNSRHGKAISTNPLIAFTIFDSHQKITKLKKGLQGTGKIEQVHGLPSIVRALLLWHKANPGIEKDITVKDILKKMTDTKIYKIIPMYLKFFNKALYSPEEYGVWKT